MDRITFLKEQTLSGKNKSTRAVLPDWDIAKEGGSIPIRKAKALYKILTEMPVFIGEQELIVGTRTLFFPKGETSPKNHTDYSVWGFPKFVNEEDIQAFGGDYSWENKRHYTPDYGILLKEGIGGVLQKARERKTAPDITPQNVEFLDSVILCYEGLSTLILRYANYARALMKSTLDEKEKDRLLGICETCESIALNPPKTFRQALQLFWFGHLTAICESCLFICYGRLDVLLGAFLGETPLGEALELVECFLLKLYDQADLSDGSYLNTHGGQLVATLGGVLPNGESAVNPVTMLFLEGIERVNLPEPEFNLRIHSKNPSEFLEKASRLTVKGYNFISYYNDDAFISALHSRGIPLEDARNYAFDLCQDIVIPGKSDSWRAHNVCMSSLLLSLLEESSEYPDFATLLSAYKQKIAEDIRLAVKAFNAEGVRMELYRDGKTEAYFSSLKQTGARPVWMGKSPMCPLPYLSGLYHGVLESATDMIYEPYPIKHVGIMVGTVVEAINSLSAIKSVVYDKKIYSLKQVYTACKNDFLGQGEDAMRKILFSAPKWGNDHPFVDQIAKDVVEFALTEINKYTTFSGGKFLSGLHQPHPVATGKLIGATPEGRKAYTPVTVSMSPENGTMKKGATATLASASIFCSELVQWNYCCMINYYQSVFLGENAHRNFQDLLLGYFARGGMQHQPNVLDGEVLKKAMKTPNQYRDIIVRLWGVSAHFVDLPRELQEEMIARLS